MPCPWDVTCACVAACDAVVEGPAVDVVALEAGYVAALLRPTPPYPGSVSERNSPCSRSADASARCHPKRGALAPAHSPRMGFHRPLHSPIVCRPTFDAVSLRDALRAAGQGQHVARVTREVIMRHDDSLPLAQLPAVLTECGVPASGIVKTRAQLTEVGPGGHFVFFWLYCMQARARGAQKDSKAA
jgi:hypothetical protein